MTWASIDSAPTDKPFLGIDSKERVRVCYLSEGAVYFVEDGSPFDAVMWLQGFPVSPIDGVWVYA